MAGQKRGRSGSDSDAVDSPQSKRQRVNDSRDDSAPLTFSSHLDVFSAFPTTAMPPWLPPAQIAVSATMLRVDPSVAQYARATVPENARPPMDEIITAKEITVFAAKWRRLPAVCVRFQKNGISTAMQVDQHLSPLGLAEDRKFSKKYTQKVKKQYHEAGLMYFDVENEEAWGFEKNFPENDLTANDWKFRDWHKYENNETDTQPSKWWKDIRLDDFYGHIPRNLWPKGQDRGAMTRVFELCQDFGDGSETTAKWDNLIAIAMIGETVLHSIDPSKNLDQEAAEAFYA